MDSKEKRKRVMARSMKLGHCVCDPVKPCPCPLFREKNVCTCAGERVPLNSAGAKVALTKHVRAAGCASKISQNDLHEVLSKLPTVEDPRLLVGMATADDAGVFQLTPEVTIVQTVDVFTPGVDDPYLFGQIAACNSLSDVYAMGGRPLTALSIIGFPIHTLPREAMVEILRGGMDTLKEAGTILLGGHSINDEEVKFGFAVTGLVHRAKVTTNAGARPGDALILTKPLGTGIVSLANQIGRASANAVEAAGKSMSTLNRAAAEIMIRHGVQACTDVTGFGLLGHLGRMAMESAVTAEIWCEALPLLPDVLEYAQAGIFSGANERNAEFSERLTEFAGDVGEEFKAVLLDPQTSGGLLMCVPEAGAGAVLTELRDAGIEAAAMIGRIAEKSDGRIRVERCRQMRPPVLAGRKGETMTKEKKVAACCAHEGPGAGGGSAMEKFEDFLGTAMQPGAVDVVTKELIAIALGLAVHCVPCTKMHIQKAMSMGIGREEIEEAAALAIAFGGCRAMMLWDELKEERLVGD